MRYLLCLLLLLGTPAHAFDRDQVEGYLLDNGLQVILKPTPNRGHVSIRLVVGVGFDDFACDEKELPHLLEHLFFSGLPGNGEADLEARMQALGGEWNAFTSDSDTAFVLEVAARNQRQALDLLLAILRETPLDEGRVAAAKRVVQREGGGRYSHLERLLDHHALGRGAHDQLAVELGLACAGRPSVEGLTLERLREVRDTWYGANNMSLIVVGDLDPRLPAYLDRRYGELPPVEVREHPALPTISTEAAPRLTLRKGLVGNGATLHWIFPEPLEDGTDYATLELLQDYLDWELYQQLRIRNGLSYGPWSDRHGYGGQNFTSLNADLEREDLDEAVQVLQDTTRRLREHGVDRTSFERLRRLAVDRQVWAVQGDVALADYYWGALGAYQDGRFESTAKAFAQVTPEQIDSTVRALFAEPGYLRIEAPLLTYEQLAWLLAALLALLALAGWWLHRRLRR
ncbi:M16 family metallopeptidase [Metapseudomonas otitidis]|uniref:M16 family metallopeptidase n=1 Tax=Metapseudomonas otitidis TaxID=319939 RepID=UPI0013F5E2E9|nr:pitrilysin family protein [Pseudomonas otitidis]